MTRFRIITIKHWITFLDYYIKSSGSHIKKVFSLPWFLLLSGFCDNNGVEEHGPEAAMALSTISMSSVRKTFFDIILLITYVHTFN